MLIVEHDWAHLTAIMIYEHNVIGLVGKSSILAILDDFSVAIGRSDGVGMRFSGIQAQACGMNQEENPPSPAWKDNQIRLWME